MTSPRRKRIKWERWQKRRNDKIARIALAIVNSFWQEKEPSFRKAWLTSLVTGTFEYDVSN